MPFLSALKVVYEDVLYKSMFTLLTYYDNADLAFDTCVRDFLLSRVEKPNNCYFGYCHSMSLKLPMSLNMSIEVL